jgi:hypothetical protein
MSGVIDRLNCIWEAILQCDIIKNSTVSEDSISELTRALNKSTPITTAENAIYDLMREFSRAGKQDFLKYIRTHGMTGMVLTCDSRTIAEELGITDRIDLRWNSNRKEYYAVHSDKGSSDRTYQPRDNGEGPRRSTDRNGVRERTFRPDDRYRDYTREQNNVYTKKDVVPRESRYRDSKGQPVSKYDKNKERNDERKKKPNSLPPVSNKEQYQMLQKLREKQEESPGPKPEDKPDCTNATTSDQKKDE